MIISAQRLNSVLPIFSIFDGKQNWMGIEHLNTYITETPQGLFNGEARHRHAKTS